MNDIHTEECTRARTGHPFLNGPYMGTPDEYPEMGRLSAEERAAVLACPHLHHDIVRRYWGLAS